MPKFTFSVRDRAGKTITGTVTMDIGKAVGELKAGRIEFRVDRSGNVHAPIGKASFDNEKLEENFQGFMDAVIRARPAAAKGGYIKAVTISSTMGPGVRVDPSTVSSAVEEGV